MPPPSQERDFSHLREIGVANCNKKRKVRLAHKIAFVKDYDRIRTVVWLPGAKYGRGIPAEYKENRAVGAECIPRTRKEGPRRN